MCIEIPPHINKVSDNVSRCWDNNHWDSNEELQAQAEQDELLLSLLNIDSSATEVITGTQNWKTRKSIQVNSASSKNQCLTNVNVIFSSVRQRNKKWTRILFIGKMENSSECRNPKLWTHSSEGLDMENQWTGLNIRTFTPIQIPQNKFSSFHTS